MCWPRSRRAGVRRVARFDARDGAEFQARRASAGTRRGDWRRRRSTTTRRRRTWTRRSKLSKRLPDDAGQIVLILGGRGKNAPYAPLAPLIERKARALVVLGEDAERIESELKAYAPVVRAKDLGEAVRQRLQRHDPATWCCSRPRAPVSICSRASSIAGECLRKRWRKLQDSDCRIRKLKNKKRASLNPESATRIPFELWLESYRLTSGCLRRRWRWRCLAS